MALNYTPDAMTVLENAAIEACRIARQNNCDVTMEFNGVSMAISPADLPVEVSARFWKEIQKRGPSSQPKIVYLAEIWDQWDVDRESFGIFSTFRITSKWVKGWLIQNGKSDVAERLVISEGDEAVGVSPHKYGDPGIYIQKVVVDAGAGTGITVNKNSCAHTFGDTACGVDLADLRPQCSCDKTKADCIRHGNFERFGGIPELPKQ